MELSGFDAVEYSVTRSRFVTAQSALQAKFDCFFRRKTLSSYQGRPLMF